MALFEVAVLEGDTPTHQLTLSIKPLSVGRAPANDLVLTQETVSWHHVQIWLEGEQVWMRDLNSRNGTFINNERVQKSHSLQTSMMTFVKPSAKSQSRALWAALTTARSLLKILFAWAS